MHRLRAGVGEGVAFLNSRKLVRVFTRPTTPHRAQDQHSYPVSAAPRPSRRTSWTGRKATSAAGRLGRPRLQRTTTTMGTARRGGGSEKTALTSFIQGTAEQTPGLGLKSLLLLRVGPIVGEQRGRTVGLLLVCLPRSLGVRGAEATRAQHNDAPDRRGDCGRLRLLGRGWSRHRLVGELSRAKGRRRTQLSHGSAINVVHLLQGQVV